MPASAGRLGVPRGGGDARPRGDDAGSGDGSGGSSGQPRLRGHGGGSRSGESHCRGELQRVHAGLHLEDSARREAQRDDALPPRRGVVQRVERAQLRVLLRAPCSLRLPLLPLLMLPHALL
eukprot:scaffold43886_cov61-Phaeocystis_antarctica.AAC.7